ncbi:MAG: polysaccharide biosynthesis protein [Gammaproteobacteria bacterium]|nr:polysaccharide biosynthesis protein [Gammaproteobacteria bacterium]
MFNFFLKWRNRSIAFSLDLCMIIFAWFSAYWLYYDLHAIPQDEFSRALIWCGPILVVQALMFCLFGLYRGVWRFASIPDLVRILKAVIIGTLGILLMQLISRFEYPLPRVIPLLYCMVLALGLAGQRLVFRWLKDYRHFFRNAKRVLVVGAGDAGESMVRDLVRHAKHLYQPVIFVDDNPVKIGRDIHGIRVAGKCKQIAKLVEKFQINLILIAIPSASSAEMRRLVNFCEETKLPFRTLPGVTDLATGRVDIKLLRNISLEDLLGRDQVQSDWEQTGQYLKKKTILVSGGGGSIGSELSRQIASLNPKRLIVIDHSEFNLYSIDHELKKKYPHLELQSILLNINDEVGLQQIFSDFHPDIVFHAAAYKHVPLLETQGRMAISNNILGTCVLAKTAVQYGVGKFILISTDKAVNPMNLMGASKRVAEMICQNLHEDTGTKFITVRFGNVLDSAGSVVPLFRKQIQEGGPVTVTHPDITRYFMSIPEAAQLIMQSAMCGNGGEIFVLDMGEPIKINYLAEQMIKLAGKNLGHDIEIIYTGLRAGEKLYEELFYDHEQLQKTPYHKILLAKASKVDKHLLMNLLTEMDHACQINNVASIYKILNELVPEYKPIPHEKVRILKVM